MEDQFTAREMRCWLALSRGPAVPGPMLRKLAITPGSVVALVEDRGNAPVPPFTADLKQYLGAPDWDGVDSDLRWLGNNGTTVLPYSHSAYPELLRNIPDPPVLMFVRGTVAALASHQIAVVGARNPSPDGVRQARELAAGLARLGVSVTSGLALGIDAHAHAGALDAGGQTIAVQGCGMDRIYPRRNAGLAERIAEHGAVISEFSTGTPPLAANFPRRNRIISGLCLGTLVVEAALRSGSLITAGLAAAQGREVFAVPGSIRNPLAKGCHLLIKQGAKLVEGVGDVLEEIRALDHLQTVAPAEPANAGDDSAALDERCRLLLDSIGFGPVAMDELVDQTGLAAGTTASLLSSLEISGLIEILPGGRIVRRLSENSR